MERKEFAARVRRAPVVCDGAMGTALYAKGVMVNRCFDELNLSNPELVQSVHRDYLAVGVDIIETNTYGANRIKLGVHGFSDRVHEVNEKGATIAREAIEAESRTGWVAGSIGPLGKPIAPIGTISEVYARETFREQADGLVAGGADLLILETFSDLREIEQAILAVRAVSREIPVIAQMTFGEDGSTPLGANPELVARKLSALDIDAIGANCSVGPELMLRVVERLATATTLPLSVQPNAGLPELVDGRVIYLSSPEYLAHYALRFLEAGAVILGGCCGTNPSHVGAMVGTVRSRDPRPAPIEMELGSAERLEKAPVPRRDKSRLANALGRKFVIAVEMDPPKGADAGLLLEKAQWLKDSEVDFLNIGDGARASARMSALSFAALLEQRVGVETILHYQCRDRNLIGIQSDLLGALALGLKNILAVTGDPPRLGDYPYATPVFDVDAVGLVKVLSRLNQGLDLAANPLGPALPFHIGVGVNPGATDFDEEMRKFERKVDAGAEYCLTQPVFEPRFLERFLDAAKSFDIPVVVGLLPLVSSRNAEFLHNEVPGMAVPDAVRQRLQRAVTVEQAQDVGVEMARDALHQAKALAAGAYVMPPFNRFEIAIEVVKDIT